MVGYIYLITDTTNGMKYTGKHHYNKEGELDPNYHGSGVIIKNIYKKRPETLKEEYIKTCYSEEEMCSDEQYYIKFFDTLWPNGYNLTEGGDGLIPCEETRKKLSSSLKGLLSGEKHPMFGKHHSEETRRKISTANKGKPAHNKGKHLSEETKRKLRDANKGKHLSEETKQKMSSSLKGLLSGEKHPLFGKHPSEETRRKMSESHKNISDETRKKMSNSHKGKPSPTKGKHHSEETKQKISESTSGEKNPMFGKHHSEEAKKKIGAVHKDKHPSEESRRKMSESRMGEKNHFFGKHHSEETKQKMSKKVLQFTLDGELIREWNSIKECGRNGFSQSAVCLCCQGKQKTHKGFVWKYKD